MSQDVVPTEGGVESSVIQEVSTPIYESRGWIKLTAILSIINGVLIAFSIVGILIAWLPIWMGVVLYKSASSIEPAKESGHKYALIESLNNMKTYFTIMGVVNLIGLIFLVGGFCIAVLAIVGGISWFDSYSY
jgi:hypothetical protein